MPGSDGSFEAPKEAGVRDADTSEATSIDDLTPQELWENIGVHRPIAGFFYNLPLYLVTLILGIAFSGILWSILYPWPEPAGYRGAATALFGLFFQVFDLGTANIMNRFIGEANVKNPQKMLHYIQYFIWYQMITGLVQTTAVSIYALYFVPGSQLAYAIWIMLIHSTTQYPGFLGVFRNVMNTLQQYNKVAVLNFIAGELVQRVTEIGFVLWGRWWGMNDPAIGEIMGIAIGSVIGLYVDDFIATAVSAWYFSKVMKAYGLTARACFRRDFDSALVKECLSWGIKSGLPGLTWGAQVFTATILWITYVPQYTTYLALAGFAGSIGGMMGMTIDLGGSISEAAFNGKPKLAQYIISQAWRYTGMIQCFLFSILLVVILVLDPVLRLIGLEYYLLSVAFVFPRMVREIQQPYNNFSGNALAGTGHINFQMVMNFFEAGVCLVSWYAFLVWFQLPQRFGLSAIIWLIPCGEMPGIVAKTALQYVFLHKKVMPIKISWFQSFVAPGIATLAIFGGAIAWVALAFEPLRAVSGTLVALIPTVIIFVMLVPFFVYFPFTGYLGAWDEGSMEILRKAARMSGPGKIFSAPAYKLLLAATRRSKLHGRFRIDDSDAVEDARDLMRIRNAKGARKVRIA